MKIEIEIDDQFSDLVEEMRSNPRRPVEKAASELMNNRLLQVRNTRKDMQKFLEYKRERPYSGRFLGIYRFKLRRALGWTNAHLMDIEDEILASGVRHSQR
jgi:hypothetical protein